MKKIIFLSIFLLSFIFFAHAEKVKAFTIVSDGLNASEIQSLYAGSVIVYDDGWQKDYWYVAPDSQLRYSLKDAKTVSRLLKEVAIGINDDNLNKIGYDSAKIDYELTAKFKGKFLLQVNNHGQVWYLNPLDNKKYQIANNDSGLKTLQKLAVQVDDVKLNAIKKINDFKFPETKKNIDTTIEQSIKYFLNNDYLYSDKIKDQTLFYGSMKGMVESLNDPYTMFFTPSGRSQFEDSIDQSLEGIGSYVEIKNGLFTIISPLANSPAEQAGLLPYDQVLMVDDVDIRGFSLEDAIVLVKGPAGSNVKLKIHRPETGEIFDVFVTRAQITIPIVTGETLTNNIAYIKINTFDQNVQKKFDQIKENIIKNNTRGLIIDLRNNPGGYTFAAANLADYWLKPGDLILKEKYSDRITAYHAKTEPSIKIPTVVIVNAGTASAAEIFTLALSKNGMAQIVGQTTFGKGTGQYLTTFADGSALKYTVMQWLGPEDTYIEGMGIEPDFKIANTNNEDKQLSKALELLR